jgi:hypothetical protein
VQPHTRTYLSAAAGATSGREWLGGSGRITSSGRRASHLTRVRERTRLSVAGRPAEHVIGQRAPKGSPHPLASSPSIRKTTLPGGSFRRAYPRLLTNLTVVMDRDLVIGACVSAVNCRGPTLYLQDTWPWWLRRSG